MIAGDTLEGVGESLISWWYCAAEVGGARDDGWPTCSTVFGIDGEGLNMPVECRVSAEVWLETLTLVLQSSL